MGWMNEKEYSSISGTGKRVFSFPCRQDRFWGPPTFYSMCTGVSFARIKRLVRDADHSRPSSTEFKNEKSNAFTPNIRLHGFEGDKLT